MATMNVWRVVVKEIRHRKLNFALGVMSVSVAVGVLVGQFTLLRAHDLSTEEFLTAKQAAADARLAKLEDDYRKYMKELGFNLLILPKDQALSEFWEKGFASHTMPEKYVATLAASGTALVQHLLPIVQQWVDWPEQKRRIILIGTRGEEPGAGTRGEKEAMLLAVPPGKAVVGFDLARDLKLKPGDTLRLMGRDFTIHKCRPQRGSAENSTIWVDLKAGQEMLGMEGRINAIEALQCLCKDLTVEQFKAKVAGYLNDDVQVVVRQNEVTLRAKARKGVADEHATAMAVAKKDRDSLRRAREGLAALLVPLVLLGSAVWIGFLTLSNVRERSSEIGILRAIGVGSRRILSVFLARALLTGLLGAVAGYALALVVSVVAAGAADTLRVDHAAALFSPLLLAGVVLAAPVLAAVASWAPASLAARQDPAVILSKE
jgi:putative ABC transport system permease protein